MTRELRAEGFAVGENRVARIMRDNGIVAQMPRSFRVTTQAVLTRISHRWSTAPPQSSALAVLRSVGLLDVLHEYDCGGLGRKPCQDGPFGASLRQAMRNAG